MTTHTPNRTNAHSKTLRCVWQMRELSHLLTCGGVEERSCGGALSTSLSRRWIAYAIAIYHWGGVGVWLVAQSPCYPLKNKSERHRSWTCSFFHRIRLAIASTRQLSLKPRLEDRMTKMQHSTVLCLIGVFMLTFCTFFVYTFRRGVFTLRSSSGLRTLQPRIRQT